MRTVLVFLPPLWSLLIPADPWYPVCSTGSKVRGCSVYPKPQLKQGPRPRPSWGWGPPSPLGAPDPGLSVTLVPQCPRAINEALTRKSLALSTNIP